MWVFWLAMTTLCTGYAIANIVSLISEIRSHRREMAVLRQIKSLREQLRMDYSEPRPADPGNQE